MEDLNAWQTSSFVVDVFVASVVAYVVYQRFISALAPVPGPFLACLTSLWIANAYRRGDWHRKVIELHKRYGPVVRVGPDAVSVGDVNAVKVIYGTGSRFWKGKFYRSGVSRGPGNLLGIVDEYKHKQRRRLLDPIYTLKSVREFEYLMHQPIQTFVEQMRRRANDDINIVEWTNVLATDVFSSATYGKSYGLLEHDRDPEMMAFVESHWSPYFWLSTLPYLGKLLRLYQGLLMVAKLRSSGRKAPLPILGWTAQQIGNALQTKASADAPPTLITKTIRLHKAHPQEFPEAAVMDHMFEIIFAGFETCGATIPKIIWRIITTNGCQQRLQKELDTLERSKDTSGLLRYDELLELPYLSACISEGVRMDPITGIALGRRVPPDGVQMNGYNIPAGTEIGITPSVISYNEDVLDAPYQFRPERYLEASKEQRMQRERMDLMFGSGPAMCPGRVMALAFVYKTIAVAFSNFEITAVDEHQTIPEINIFPVKWRDVGVRFNPRT